MYDDPTIQRRKCGGEEPVRGAGKVGRKYAARDEKI